MDYLKTTTTTKQNTKTVTYAKISPKMVKPRDRAGKAEEEVHSVNSEESDPVGESSGSADRQRKGGSVVNLAAVLPAYTVSVFSPGISSHCPPGQTAKAVLCPVSSPVQSVFLSITLPSASLSTTLGKVLWMDMDCVVNGVAIVTAMEKTEMLN